ncbi:MAG: GGDEF domain-containing protein, partial [Bacillota bacterium]|nr:GGDEF domain-containing protein [Bacillota bacterium]
ILRKSFILKSGLLLGLWIMILLVIFVFYKSKSEMDKIVYFDELTGAYNRNKFYECINQEIARSKRYNIDFSIIMYDIDHFKRINDIYGHIAGDLVLKELTNLVKESIRINDCLFRFGGDEFVILLLNVGLEDAKKVAEKIRVNTENADVFVENITLSLGVVEYMENENEEGILNRVDSMLYKSKETGRNKISYI